MNRRVAAIVAGAVLALVAVVVVVARRDTSDEPNRLPIALGAPSSGAAADAALAPYGGITYHLDADVPSLDGSARAYRVTSGDPTAFTQRLERALGLHDDPRVTVTAHDWSYNSDPNGTVSSSPGSVTTPALVLPTEDQAKGAAFDLLHQVGFDTTGAAFSTDLGDNQWFVRVDPVVDGVATEGMGATVIVGENGRILAASGTLGSVVAADDYPLAGTKTAVDRLNAGEGLVGPQPLEAQDTPSVATASAPPAVASDEPPATDDAVPGSVAPGEPVPGLPPDSEPPSTDTIPPPAPQDVTLTGAERVLLFATGTDGTIWLVPAYRFTTADGAGPTVLAVADRFLAADVPPTGR